MFLLIALLELEHGSPVSNFMQLSFTPPAHPNLPFLSFPRSHFNFGDRPSDITVSSPHPKKTKKLKFNIE